MNRLRADTEHGDPVEHPDTGFRVCRKCHERYRWSSETGEYDREPYGACSGLKRTGGLDAKGTGMKRKSCLSPVSDTNSGREHQKDEAFREWIRGLPCVGCGDDPPNEAAHFRTRGAGWGDWTDGGNLYPACRACHQTQHDLGIQTVQREWHLDLAEITTQLGRQYREREASEPEGRPTS